LPCLIFSPRTVEVLCKGGTNAAMAPQVDYFSKVFFPIAKRFGVQMEVEVVRRGFYPKGMGIVKLRVHPIHSLNPIIIQDLGKITNIEIFVFHAGYYKEEHAKEVVAAAEQVLYTSLSDRGIVFSTVLSSESREKAFGDGIGILITATSSTGCILAGSALDNKGMSLAEIGTNAANELIQNLSHGGCVDEYLADQLIIFMALASGKSRLKTGPLSLHTTTSIHFSHLMTGAKFNVQEIKGEPQSFLIECDGIGFKNSSMEKNETSTVV